MKYLINICAHDGIISHYNGVGTMTTRYIEAVTKYFGNKNIAYELNLFTPEYNENSFGYSIKTFIKHKKLANTKIIQISNNSNGDVNYGKPEDWKILSKNTANYINNLKFENYSKVITIFNDTPYAGLGAFLKKANNHINIWIPHSTVKIHKVDSAIEKYKEYYNDRVKWEQEAINYINNEQNSFLGSIGEFISKHLIDEYNLDKLKILNITNGEIIKNNNIIKSYSNECKKLFDKIKDYDKIMLSFSRAEKYKNLEATMKLGNFMNMPTIVIAQSYYKEQPILDEYRNLSIKYKSNLFIDCPFDFAKYILNNYDKLIIMVIPSKKEIMGLIINEIRALHKENILIVSNNIDGLKEQITDEYDGLLVNIDNVEESKNKILKHLNKKDIINMMNNSQKTIAEKYNFLNNFNNFMDKIIGENYE